MIDHPLEQQMDSDHADFTAAAGSQRLDELGAGPRPASRPAPDDANVPASVADDRALREAVALAGVLTASIPVPEALARALSIGLRLLPSAHELIVCAPVLDAVSHDADRWTRVASARRTNGRAGDAPGDRERVGGADRVDRRPSATGIPAEVERRLHRERTPIHAGAATHAPLWLVAADGTAERLGGVLTVRWEDDGGIARAAEATGLSLLAPCCAVLLARRVHDDVARRMAASMQLTRALPLTPPPPEEVATADVGLSVAPEDLAVLRATAAALRPLFGATQAHVFVPSVLGTWSAYPASSADSEGERDRALLGEPHGAGLDEGGPRETVAEEIAPEIAEVIAALGDQDMLALAADSPLVPLATRLRTPRAALTQFEPAEAGPARGFLVLAVRLCGQIAALIALDATLPRDLGGEREAAASADLSPRVGMDLSSEVSMELSMARAVLSLAGATLLAVRLTRSAAAQDRARDAFVSLTVHELRSPLTAVKGYAQLLLRQAKRLGVPEQMHVAVAAIDEQSTRMADMISELHDAVRIRRGDLELHTEPVDLVTVAAQALQQQRKLFPQHTITLEAGDQRLIGDWDALRLQQVVSALVSNAARFSPGGGEVAVEVERAEVEGRPAALLCVRDRGVGVPEPDRDRIFEYLYRAPETQRRRLSGLGIGLFVSRTVVERMGGRLWLEASETGDASGSTFCLLLPLLTECE